TTGTMQESALFADHSSIAVQIRVNTFVRDGVNGVHQLIEMQFHATDFSQWPTRRSTCRLLHASGANFATNFVKILCTVDVGDHVPPPLFSSLVPINLDALCMPTVVGSLSHAFRLFLKLVFRCLQQSGTPDVRDRHVSSTIMSKLTPI